MENCVGRNRGSVNTSHNTESTQSVRRQVATVEEMIMIDKNEADLLMKDGCLKKGKQWN